MNSIKVLHIGYGKCSTTLLQKKIFPQIVKKYKINYWSNTYILKSLCNKEIMKKMNLIKKKLIQNKLSHYNKVNLKKNDNYFISCENLINTWWNPEFYKQNCKFIKETFGKDVHIVITIRKPSEFLRSVYLELIHNSIFIKEKDFFLDDKTYKKTRKKYKWNIEKFDYLKIISLYKKNFHKVSVVKYEEIKNFQFLKNIFKLKNNEVFYLKKIYKNNRIHTSYTSKTVKTAFLINNIFKLFGFKLFNYENRINSKLEKFKFSNKQFLNKYLKEFKIHNLLSKRLNKLLNSKPFKLSNDIYKRFKITKLDENYKKIQS